MQLHEKVKRHMTDLISIDTLHTSATDAVEINTSDVIYVGSSTVFANARSESVSLLYTTVDPTDASIVVCQNMKHYLMWML